MRAEAPRSQQAGGRECNGGCPGGTLVPSVDVRHFQFCTKRYRYHVGIGPHTLSTFSCRHVSFSGSLPRRVGFWTTTDRQQQQVLRETRSLRHRRPLSVIQNARTTRSNRPYTQECKVCMLWHRKLNKQQTTCLKMCRVPSSLPLQTCIPSCVAWCTLLPGHSLFCTRMQMITTSSDRVLVTCFCSNMVVTSARRADRLTEAIERDSTQGRQAPDSSSFSLCRNGCLFVPWSQVAAARGCCNPQGH